MHLYCFMKHHIRYHSNIQNVCTLKIWSQDHSIIECHNFYEREDSCVRTLDASHLTTFLSWDRSPRLMVTPARGLDGILGDFCGSLITWLQVLLPSGWIVKRRDCYDKHCTLCLVFLHTLSAHIVSKLNGACKSTMAVYVPDALAYQSTLRNAAAPSLWPASEYDSSYAY